MLTQANVDRAQKIFTQRAAHQRIRDLVATKGIELIAGEGKDTCVIVISADYQRQIQRMADALARTAHDAGKILRPAFEQAGRNLTALINAMKAWPEFKQAIANLQRLRTISAIGGKPDRASGVVARPVRRAGRAAAVRPARTK